jgi:hypothetical protein
MTTTEAKGVLKREKICRVCNSDLILAICRWETFWIHCNHCGAEIPALLLAKYPRIKS